jgi:hypothetical protein
MSSPRKLSRRSAIAGALAALVMPEIPLAAQGLGPLYTWDSIHVTIGGVVFKGLDSASYTVSSF